MRIFRPPRRVVEVDTYGPEPVGQAGAAVLERYSHGQLSGGALDGFVHYNMKGDPMLTFSGFVSSPQQFQGAAQLGSVMPPGIHVQAYPAFPNASAPPALSPWLQDWTELEGVVG